MKKKPKPSRGTGFIKINKKINLPHPYTNVTAVWEKHSVKIDDDVFMYMTAKTQVHNN